ncbi:transketolase [Chloroflexota bacterium]
MKEQEINEFRNNAREIRRELLNMVYRTKSAHIGSSLSIVEILVALYFKCLRISPNEPEDKNRDRFILSKGHGCPALYTTLARRGFFSSDVLRGFAVDGGTLEQHPTRNIGCGIEVSTGSLGHGLSIGAGMAIAAKYDRANYRIFVLLSDGELDEGSVWEAAMFASHHRLDNLIAIVDYNKIQALGRTNEVVNLEPLASKWHSFGWEAKEIDGHNFEQIINAFEMIPLKPPKPSVIIAHTVKGKGISFMEDRLLWHYRYPDDEEYAKALKELS